MRADRKRRLRNLKVESELRTLTRKFRKLLAAGPSEELKATYAFLIKRLDQAQAKGIIHRNTVFRNKSRLARHFAKLSSK